jgi:tRNA pseudouridine55 synthase
MANFHGLLVIDKPSGITSRDAVDHVEEWFPRGTRIGHTGTLDPLASGVLVLCIGAATRLTEYIQRMTKCYRAELILGATSDTDDADGAVTPTPNAIVPTREQLDQTHRSFIGTVEQVPPAYSAAKVTGRRAYALARQGQVVHLEAKSVRIDCIDIIRFEYPHLEIVVKCGKGTYIRSIARDLGQRLGAGAYISALGRLEVGTFTADDAVALDASADAAREHMLPLWRAMQDHEPVRISDAEAGKLRQGQRIAVPHGVSDVSGEIMIGDNAGHWLAVTEIADGRLAPRKILLLD